MSFPVAPFMIYLLETGICLSLLYLAWWLFLRRETYFNFNRLYLVGSILLALLVPLFHVNLEIPLGSSLENPARSISSFRTGYEELIQLLDADFGREPGAEHAHAGTEPGMEQARGEDGIMPREGIHGEGKVEAPKASGDKPAALFGAWKLSSILLIIYISGVIYFLIRFVYLLVRLRFLTKHNRVSLQQEFRMVEIGEEISPFSFFRFLFVNTAFFSESELRQVLEHEKAHIQQKHSMDHLFAHGFAVFQWFNPLAWQIRKALKTTHEYIADRHVLDKGIERNDYQALLLRQVIGYHSVELVNNFNLKPIKKRIAMMNRNKSGWAAKLRASLVIPVSIILFFLFAEFTLKGSDLGASDAGQDLSGLWISETNNEFSKALYIQGSSFSFSEGIDIREYFMKAEGDALVLSQQSGSPGTRLKYELKGDELIIWWNKVESTSYQRSASKNTLDHQLAQSNQNMDLPYISQYRLMEPGRSICRIGFEEKQGDGQTVTFNNRPVKFQELSGLVEKEKEKVSLLDQKLFTVMFLADRDTPMSLVDEVRQELRKIQTLLIAEGGYPQGDLELSPLLYHAVGLPRLLPPLNAKVLDKKEVAKRGTNVFTIDLSARNSSPKELEEGIKSYISGSKAGKYIISLEYDGEVPYGQYIESVDMVWKVVYSFRKQLAQEKYGLAYDQLGDDLQREIRKAYPMALAEFMQD